MNLNNLYTKFLIRSHTIMGVFVIFFFYIAVYFGTISFFKPYLNSWENISRHFYINDQSKLNLDLSINKALEKLNNPVNDIQIQLPSFKDKALGVNYGFSEKVYINPNTNEILDTTKENNLISSFFYRMHMSMNIKPGRILMGISAITMLYLTFSGLYLWLINRKKRVQSKKFWVKWHKNLALLVLPFILVFSITGSFLGAMFPGSSPFALSATNWEEKDMSKIVRPTLLSKECKDILSGEKASMQNLDELFSIAQKSYPELKITNISLFQWRDKNACANFSGYLKNNRFLTGKANRLSISLSGIDGSIKNKKDLQNSHPMGKLFSGFLFFHTISDEGIFVRVIMSVFGIVFATCLIFGMMIWLSKKASKHKKEKRYFSIVSKLSLSLFVGIIPSTSFLLFLYWIIPFDVIGKETWVIGGFYAFLSFTFLYSMYNKKALDVIRFFFKLNAIFLLFTVIFRGVRTDFFTWNSFQNGLSEIFWVDLVLLIFAFSSFLIAKKMPNIKLLERI